MSRRTWIDDLLQWTYKTSCRFSVLLDPYVSFKMSVISSLTLSVAFDALIVVAVYLA